MVPCSAENSCRDRCAAAKNSGSVEFVSDDLGEPSDRDVVSGPRGRCACQRERAGDDEPIRTAETRSEDESWRAVSATTKALRP